MTARNVVWLLLLSLLADSHGQFASNPPVPHWIGTASGATNALFQKSFVSDSPVLKSILLAACDGNAQVDINGQAVGKISGAAKATGLDITRLVRRGTNEIRVRASGTNGPARLSVLIELNHDLSNVRWITSDSSWLAFIDSSIDYGPPTRSSEPVRSLGLVSTNGTINPFDAKNAFDAYNSWKLALSTNSATDPATFTLLPGFKAELLRSAQPGEGSWVSMAFDPKGRLTVARESRGLLRLTIGKNRVETIEVINDSLLECRGLLYAHDALFVNANNSKAFYRLRDTDHNDRFDEIKLLLRTGGGVGHGRNHVVLGPDGAIWLVHGNNVALPEQISRNSPLQNYRTDSLIPCPFDDAMFDGDVTLPAGHIIRTDSEGKSFELFAAGFRNPLDIAFDRYGEMFTFDADMEWDVGSPWYRPNRINHVISGADFGWRRGSSKFPDYFPETLPSTVDIGLASPTGIEFGTKSHFPAPYNDALFIADWAYGRVLAVHLKPLGSSYTGSSELFMSGRPLNVTDLTFGPDGAMYLITGGRTTQSGLYRISYVGQARPPSMGSRKELAIESKATQARRLRRELESYHTRRRDYSAERTIQFIWPRLGHPDQWIRHAARVALEHQPVTLWQPKALSETNLDIALTAWMAVNHTGTTNMQRALLNRVARLDLAKLNDSQLVQVIRVLEVACSRFGPPAPDRAATLRHNFSAIYPAKDWHVNHRLVVLLTYLQSDDVLPKTLQLLANSDRPEDLMQYLFYLRYVRDGWSESQREEWMRGFVRAQQKQGARDYYVVLKRVRDEFLKSVPLNEAERLVQVETTLQTQTTSASNAVSNGPPLKFVKEWQSADFDLTQPLSSRSLQNGKAAFQAAQCILCHRFGSEGGLVGPDLTSVASRFDLKTLLESIVEPSKVIDDKFRNINFTLKDGNLITGTIEREDAENVYVRENPLTPSLITVRKNNLARREASAISPMPAGLLNQLQKEQVLDLLGLLEAGAPVNTSESKR